MTTTAVVALDGAEPGRGVDGAPNWLVDVRVGASEGGELADGPVEEGLGGGDSWALVASGQAASTDGLEQGCRDGSGVTASLPGWGTAGAW